jgi:hypothetical protein
MYYLYDCNYSSRKSKLRRVYINTVDNKACVEFSYFICTTIIFILINT